MTNAQLATALGELADLMALDGSDRHRIAHYKGTATAIRRFEHSVAEMVASGVDLTRVPGIGSGLAALLEDLCGEGASPRLDEYRSRIPAGLLSVLRLDGVGATRARTLWKTGGVESVADLERAIAQRTVHRLDGFGPAVVDRIGRGLEARAQLEGRILLSDADRACARVTSVLDDTGWTWQATGDLARRLKAVSSIELVVVAPPEDLHRALADRGTVALETAPGANPVELVLGTGPRTRIVAADASHLEAVAHHLTGPPEYLAALGDRALASGLTLTPLGLAHGEGLRIATGPAMYEALDLPWIPPELREDEATLDRIDRLGAPSLVTMDQVRGDLHMHTTWSDGAASLDRMVRAASERGYQYVAITDHSPSTGPVSGLDADGLRDQAEEIHRVREHFGDLTVFTGVEVDILSDGTLDLDDETLAGLDMVVASVHGGFEMDEGAMTRRIIKAMENPFVQILGHPTGRKLGRRLGYPVSVSDLLDAARELQVAIEVNGNPRRLDLEAPWLWHCRERGVNVVVSSDAHSVSRLDNVHYAVDQARRGWLETQHVVNTQTVSDVQRWMRRRRA